ncbi:hypothetical protein FACS189479_07640 [Spirochaetia bacterium]|nr:hypothetical protein FACS189479_07640 [Spirochaetia bacterium]
MINEKEYENWIAVWEKGDYEEAQRIMSIYPEQVLSWLKKAASGGNADAQEALVETFKELVAAAEKGDAESQSNLGFAYLLGFGTEADYKQSEFWFKKATAHGSITVKLTAKSGLMLTQAMLPAQNFRELLEGAQAKNASFQYGLGFAYLKGCGTEVNAKQAEFWFQQAAAQGHHEAFVAFNQVKVLLDIGSDNFDNVVPEIKQTKGLATKHPLIYSIVSMVVVSYLATVLDIGWLHSLAIFVNICGILGFLISIIGIVLALTKSTRVKIICLVLYFLSIIPMIGLSVHYIKGRKTGNPISIVLQNPFEAVRNHFFGTGKGMSTEFAEKTYTLDVKSENGAAKIFNMQYGKDETVIRLIRTTGSHKAISIAPPGEANSFYIQDKVSGETWPIKELRFQDYEEAAGVDLIFEPFRSRSFDLIEGIDTSKSAWHFRDINVEENQ